MAAGAQSLVTTPMRLSLERRRKNDRPDVREAMCGKCLSPEEKETRIRVIFGIGQAAG